MNLASRLSQYAILDSKPPPIERSSEPHILIYSRVSSNKQIKEGHSIEVQKQRIVDYIKAIQLKGTMKFFEDAAISGKNMKNRPGFQKMIEFMKKGDTMISYSLSRLGRNTREILNFIQKLEEDGITLILIDVKVDTNTSMGKLFFTIMASLGQFEREQTSERTKNVMNQRKEQGYLVTRPPLGFKVEPETKKLIPSDEEQRVFTLIMRWIFEDPQIKDATITKRLQEKFDKGEITIRNAKKVYQSTVSNIIKRHDLRNMSFTKKVETTPVLPTKETNPFLEDYNPFI